MHGGWTLLAASAVMIQLRSGQPLRHASDELGQGAVLLALFDLAVAIKDVSNALAELSICQISFDCEVIHLSFGQILA